MSEQELLALQEGDIVEASDGQGCRWRVHASPYGGLVPLLPIVTETVIVGRADAPRWRKVERNTPCLPHSEAA